MIYLLTKLLRPGVRLLFARHDPCFPVCAVELPRGRRILLVERTYRAPADVRVIVEPTDEDMETARTGPPSATWGHPRALHWDDVDWDGLVGAEPAG